ncbi:unnamed protein product [Parnassius apollo]|uniref:(apollo) hypothetical protein n=1 Tax=Parnassius apollo TaxID=110799 RepID=A0A8S3X6X8_PARAO|nr:unnamed protein product [Parnassius apollo]
MEHRRLRKGPLPGGRQGASGAGAGRDSMRTASRARGAARPPSSPSHPSSPPACLVSAGSSQAQQSAPATGGVRRMRWTINMNSNALRAYFRAKGGEIGGFAYRARMHRLFTELEPSITVTEQNLADRVRYILRSNIFDGAELERLRREAVPSSNENATTEGAEPQVAEQPAHVDAAENTPVVADSNDEGTFTQELEIEQMRSTLEEAIMETRSTPLENRPRLPRIALSKRNRAVVRALNPMLVTYLEASRDLCETDSILFGAALAVCRIIGAKLSTAGRTTGQSSAIPAWRTRIEERIAKTRALIGRLICFRSGNTRPRIVRTVRMAFAGTNVSLSQPDIMQKLTERIDDLKQRIAAWGKRIRRYTERSTLFNQNHLFQSDQKRLYKSLERPMVSGTGPVPNQADTVAFWRSLWSEPVNHNEGPWTEVVASQCAGITPMDPVTITPDDVAEAVRRAPNWKSPGLDGLHHYWLKGFVSDQKRLYKSLERPMVSGTGPVANQADTVAFCRNLWSEPVNHNEGPWTEVAASQGAGITPMDPVITTPDDVAEVVRRAPICKSPGLDGLHHYWLKGFMVCHDVLARQFQEALNQKLLPSLFTTGITHLVPKGQSTTDPSKSRPITGLRTIYKILTSIFINHSSPALKSVPETNFRLIQNKTDDDTVNVICAADGAFPAPNLTLATPERRLDGVSHELKLVNGRYSAVASVTLFDADLPSPAEFICTLRIPLAKYAVRKEAIYYPGPISTTPEMPTAADLQLAAASGSKGTRNCLKHHAEYICTE